MVTTARRYSGPAGQEDMPYLLTPGPLTTSRTVKATMMADWGSRDAEFRKVVADIRSGLLALANCDNSYECVIMQGSGTFAIEAALGSFCPSGENKTLVVRWFKEVWNQRRSDSIVELMASECLTKVEGIERLAGLARRPFRLEGLGRCLGPEANPFD